MTKEELLKKKIAMVSLGCDKNTVDAEKMLFGLKQYGFSFTNNLDEANIVIINTCAFIKSAKEESINTILKVAERKKKNLEKLVVTGCLSQRYYSTLVSDMPEVDLILRLKNNEKIVEELLSLYGVGGNVCKTLFEGRFVTTPKHYAFLKIADGCNNMCSYCTIPQIRGRFASIEIKKVIKEAKLLAKKGVKELILVAQDVTNYGSDLYDKPKLVLLLKKLSRIRKIKWIRLHYCYPNLITDELLKQIDKNNKIVKYIDIPMQHCNNKLLRLMHRKDTKEKYFELLSKIRSLKHYISIRSTFIVGFPGETKEDFNELLDFLKTVRLQNVGFFAYSREEYTLAYNMPNQVSEKIKQERLKMAQEVQQQILIDNQKKFVNSQVKAVCEHIFEDGTSIMRSGYNSPSVDTVILVNPHPKIKVKLGEFYNVQITKLNGLDLQGDLI
jgi:ribosomal protein S12 methylthiotransferase